MMIGGDEKCILNLTSGGLKRRADFSGWGVRSEVCDICPLEEFIYGKFEAEMVVPGWWCDLHGEVHEVSERSDIEME